MSVAFWYIDTVAVPSHRILLLCLKLYGTVYMNRMLLCIEYYSSMVPPLYQPEALYGIVLVDYHPTSTSVADCPSWFLALQHAGG